MIHGDMQRKHVIKGVDGKYCILDFGCMAFDPKVSVLGVYNETHHLTEAELNSLLILMKASYAAYYFKTSILIDEGDKSLETLEWHNK